eukprot:10729225-Lingulodinium_polyedra.AAC.1
MRSHRASVAAAARKMHARAPCARWFSGARGVRERAICEPLRQRVPDSTSSLCSVLQTLHDDAI